MEDESLLTTGSSLDRAHQSEKLASWPPRPVPRGFRALGNGRLPWRREFRAFAVFGWPGSCGHARAAFERVAHSAANAAPILGPRIAIGPERINPKALGGANFDGSRATYERRKAAGAFENIL